MFCKEFGLYIRHNGDCFHLLYRKLALYLKSAYRFNKITKELHPVGQIMREGKYIYYTATYGKLARFINKINAVKIIFYQELIDKVDAELITYGDLKRIFCQRSAIY